VIRTNGGKWQKATKVEFAARLQKLIYESPELIPTYEGDAPAVFAREAGLPGSGYTDLLGVDVEGNILLVETKLARNDEVRRTVIGQVLEYAAYLWKMTFKDFDSLFVSREAISVLDLLEAKAPGIVREEVRDVITSNLSSGAFQLFIAVDKMNDELEKIISYVSSRGNGLRLEVLEFDLHQSGSMEILVPRRYGQLATPTGTGAPSTRVKTVDEILATISNERHRRIFQLLVAEWEESGCLVKPGTVGASFQAKIGEKYRAIFWDNLQNAFSELSKYHLPEERVSKYREAVAKLPGFSHGDVLSKAQPVTKFDAVSEDTVRGFLHISQQLVNDWRSVGLLEN